MDPAHRLASPVLRTVVGITTVTAIVAGVWNGSNRGPDIEAVAKAEIAAMEAHRDALKAVATLDDDQAKAALFEDGPLPLWQAALHVANEEGADVAVKRLHLRVISTEYLIDAFRTGDDEQLRRAEHAWAKASETGRGPSAESVGKPPKEGIAGSPKGM